MQSRQGQAESQGERGWHPEFILRFVLLVLSHPPIRSSIHPSVHSFVRTFIRSFDRFVHFLIFPRIPSAGSPLFAVDLLTCSNVGHGLGRTEWSGADSHQSKYAFIAFKDPEDFLKAWKEMDGEWLRSLMRLAVSVVSRHSALCGSVGSSRMTVRRAACDAEPRPMLVLMLMLRRC